MSIRRRPAISVLLVSRNRLKFLEDALHSLAAQTFRDFEVILIDDGSAEDLSTLIVDKFVRIPASGISYARNLAMKVADGAFYFVMDSDDLIDPECLAKEFALVMKGYDLVVSYLSVVNMQARPSGLYLRSRVQTFEECLSCKGIVHPSSLFRASSIRDLWYDEQFDSAVDYDFLLRFLLRRPRIGVVNEPLYFYRHHPGQERKKARQAMNARCIRLLHSTYLTEVRSKQDGEGD